MKSLEEELVESKAKIQNLTSTKPVVDNRSVSVSLKPKTKKVYIPHFKRNNKEKAYFARLDKGKSSDVDAEVSKPKSKPVRHQDIGPTQAPGPVPFVQRGDPRPIQALGLVPYRLWAQAQ